MPDAIRARGLFRRSRALPFGKEEPSMREVLRMVESDEVYVVPDFISEGYFHPHRDPARACAGGQGDPGRETVARSKYCEAGRQSPEDDRGPAPAGSRDGARRRARGDRA